MTSPEHDTANNALLQAIHRIKLDNPVMNRRDLLYIPEMHNLVGQFIDANTKLIHSHVNRISKYRKIDPEDAMQMAIVGRGGEGTAPGGVIGALLEFDYSRQGYRGFQAYMQRCIERALAPPLKERLTREAIGSKTFPLPEEEYSQTWLDRTAKAPEDKVIARDLVDALKDAARELPFPYKKDALYMIDYLLEHHTFPRCEDMQVQVNGKSKQVGSGHLQRAWNALIKNLAETSPDLAEQGLNDWATVMTMFKNHKGKKVEWNRQ